MASQPAGSSTHVVALAHFEAGRLTEAAAACHAILHRAPHDWLALRLLGHIRNSERAFHEAARLLAAALQAAPADAPDVISMLNGLAEALRGKQDFAAALACYHRALARDPRDAMTLQNLGSTLVALNRHAEALEQYRLARSVAPDSIELRLNEGVAMLALGRWPEGWERLEARLSMARDQFPQDVPQWRGETDIAGRSILLQAEQGLAIRCSSSVTPRWWPPAVPVWWCAHSPCWARCWRGFRSPVRCSPTSIRCPPSMCSARS